MVRSVQCYLLIWLVLFHAFYILHGVDSVGVSWWRVHPSKHDAFDNMRDDALLLIPSDIDDSSIHSCYEYKLFEGNAHVDWNGNLKNGKTAILITSGSFCYPSIIITGLRKCSTSALYALFESFPNAVTNKVKENCPFVGSRSIIQYFESLNNYVDPGKYIVDGCVDLTGNMWMRDILRNPHTYYIVLTRNYVDWLWSAYNYWCNGKYDGYCETGGNWAIPHVNYRSAGYFHEIVQGSVNGTFVPNPLTHNNSCDKAGDMYSGFLSKLLTKTSLDQVSMFASEELEKSPENIWRKISIGAGVPDHHPALVEFKSYRYNTQLQKDRGADVKLEISKYKAGVYEISNFETVLPETKSLLDVCWKKDCLWASNITGFRYSSCGGDNTMSGEQFSSLAVKASATGNNDVDESAMRLINSVLGFGNSAPNMNGFLNSNMRQCFMDIFKLLDKHKNIDKTIFGEFEPIFIVSNFPSDVELISKFLYLGIGIDLSIVLNANESMKNGKMPVDKCNAARIIGTESSMVDIVSSTDVDGKTINRIVIRQGFSCAGISSRKVVLLVRDPMSMMWRDYQLKEIASYGDVVGGSWLSNDQLYHFNWTAWDMHLDSRIDYYIALTFNSIQSQILSKFIDDNLLLTSVENFIGKDRVASLTKILNLLISSSFNCKLCQNSLALMQHIALSYDSNVATCGRVVLTSSSLRADIMVGRKHFDIAFSSSHKLCQLKERYKTHQILKIVPALAALNNTCDKINLVYDKSNQCKLRYSKRRFIKNIVKPPVILLAIDNAAIHSRLLMEHATGLLTGAANTNHSLYNLFQGEYACGQRMMAIHAHTSIITPLFTKSGTSTISMNSWGKKKCMRGMLRGFTRGMLIVKDPLMALFQNCSSLLGYKIDHSQVGKSVDPSHYEKASAIVQCLLYSAKNFDPNWLDAFWQLPILEIVYGKVRKDLLFVSYESLLYNTNKVDILQGMLDFAHHGKDVDRQRLECAYSFVDSRYYSGKINTMMSFYRELDKKLLCEIMYHSKVYHVIIKFKFRHLVEDIDCSPFVNDFEK
jgi:hypothetical protein